MNWKIKYLNKSSNNLFWLLCLGIPYLLWMYSIGIELNKHISKRRRIHPIFFKLFTGYLLFIYIPFGIGMSILGKYDLLNVMTIIASFALLLLIVLTSVTIIRFETKKKFEKTNRVKLIFMFFLFIIGVWYIQPKLNKYTMILF
jgi:hypothetical protein